MIFDGRPIDEIADEEIVRIVREHIGERQHLEFKATVNLAAAEDRLELLLDIVSLANGGGGYLFIGIRDDGRGSAARFENPGDTRRIAQSIRSLCLDHIAERIDGLEVRERLVEGNPLVIVRIPTSARTPHMVKFQEGTHFWSRYESGKRAMTLAEIRSSFTDDAFGRRLANIEQAIQQVGRGSQADRREELLTFIQTGRPFARLTAESGRDLLQADAQILKEVVRERPAFYLGAAPEGLQPRAVDVDSAEIRRLFREAPDSRPAGWIVTSRTADVARFAEGIRYRDRGLETGQLELLTNGCLEYECVLRENFYWRQAPEETQRQPRLWPYPVIEYPLSFLKLYKSISVLAGLTGSHYLELQYVNINRHILPAGTPTDFGFLLPQQLEPFVSRVLTK